MINPDECIDCALCEPECPANAIFSEDELPEGQEAFIELNAELSEKWVITSLKLVNKPADREEWNGKPNKLQYLENNHRKAQHNLFFLYSNHTFLQLHHYFIMRYFGIKMIHIVCEISFMIFQK